MFNDFFYVHLLVLFLINAFCSVHLLVTTKRIKQLAFRYVPFCDSRKEMDGFRFWKRGYWSNHLAGRRYHISALYVVDLQKFRQLAAGDRLRGQYQGLSSDPNSLSNLDQVSISSAIVYLLLFNDCDTKIHRSFIQKVQLSEEFHSFYQHCAHFPS
ncbi:unnamed protein product [Haemonchus placei]|uniref:Glyco_transf_24 domain-containing protein n=1 Tax=Haemonchus placei TaxID=6290 RepID=A0A0N4X767_HAEPC|nr:unnamed protein product [Haemonchus placei]